jgi:hypothetical protein
VSFEMKRFLFGTIITFTLIVGVASSLLQKNDYFNTPSAHTKRLAVDDILEYSKKNIIQILDRVDTSGDFRDLQGALNDLFEAIIYEKDDFEMYEVTQKHRARKIRKSFS